MIPPVNCHPLCARSKAMLGGPVVVQNSSGPPSPRDGGKAEGTQENTSLPPTSNPGFTFHPAARTSKCCL